MGEMGHAVYVCHRWFVILICTYAAPTRDFMTPFRKICWQSRGTPELLWIFSSAAGKSQSSVALIGAEEQISRLGKTSRVHREPQVPNARTLCCGLTARYRSKYDSYLSMTLSVCASILLYDDIRCSYCQSFLPFLSRFPITNEKLVPADFPISS
jgi:hypothetical protein